MPLSPPPLHAIAYLSSATHPIEPATLDMLLMASRERNREAQVTGALLHHDGGFFQYLEGPPAGVQTIYSRVRRSRLHHNLIELLDETIPARLFRHWHMACCEAAPTQIQQLALARWRSTVGDLHASAAGNDGAGLLLEFWQRNRRERR